MQGFFPDIRHLPRTALYDLASHRIAAVTVTGPPRIPFSAQLCRYVEEITGGNLRRALPTLERILCEVGAPHKTKQSPEFIANYVDRIAIRSLIAEKLIPDIHSSDFRTIPYPVPIDALSFLIYTADVAILRACLDDAIKARYGSASAGKKAKQVVMPGKKIRAPYLRDADFTFMLEKLHKAQLIERVSSAIRLTPLGKVVALFASRPYFLSESEASLKNDGLDYDPEYIENAQIVINHEEIAQDYILRKF